MKKVALFILVLILSICSLTFAGCKNKSDKEQNSVQAPFCVTLVFDLNGIEGTSIDSVQYFANQSQVLPTVDDAEQVDGFELVWFFESECKNEFADEYLTNHYNANATVTLYLGYKPKTYQITYTNADQFKFEGEFPTSYVYGVGARLPQVNLGLGYQVDSGNWYYGDGENDYFTTGISTTICQDLVLTFVAKPIKYVVTYDSGIYGLEMQNPNITEYDVTMGTVKLLTPSAEGKVFDHWEYRTTSGKAKVIDSINLDLFMQSMSFTIRAVWKQ